jgi:hypothetical protein
MKLRPIPIEWQPDLPIFAAEPFLRAVGDEYGWLGGFEDEVPRCVLPYTVVKRGPLRMVRFRVETIPISMLSGQQEQRFLDEAVEFFRSAGADLIVPATTNTIFKTIPSGAVAAPYATFIVDLKQPEEALFGALHASHRRKVRLAMKAGVQVRDGLEQLELVYRLVRDTFKRSRLNFMSYPAFRCYVEGLGENVKVLVVEHGDVVQACAVLPFSNYAAYYVYGGSIIEPAPGATNLLHWEAMRLFRGLGVARYDFVGARVDPPAGSKQEGLMQYKQRFGGELVQGYMWKYNLHPVKSLAYSWSVRVLRGGDIVDQERHKLLPVRGPQPAVGNTAARAGAA